MRPNPRRDAAIAEQAHEQQQIRRACRSPEAALLLAARYAKQSNRPALRALIAAAEAEVERRLLAIYLEGLEAGLAAREEPPS